MCEKILFVCTNEETNSAVIRLWQFGWVNDMTIGQRMNPAQLLAISAIQKYTIVFGFKKR